MTSANPTLSPRARGIRSMFSEIAPSYDRLNHLLSLSIDRLWRRATVKRALNALHRESHPARRVLDVCTGTGDLAQAFARMLPSDALVTGADFSHAMLQRAQDKLNHFTHSQNSHTHTHRLTACATVAEADALRLPFADGVFNIASVAFGLRNFVDREGGIREMARVVEPGGRVVVLEFSQPNAWWIKPWYRLYLHGWLPLVGFLLTRSDAYRYLADTVEAFPAPSEVTQWMAQAGLRNVTAEPLTGGIVVLYIGEAP